MSETNQKKGFTLVELQVGAVALGIMALTGGLILVHGWRAWRDSNEIVDMQRDVSLAAHAMAKQIRACDIDDITVGTNSLVCGGTTFTKSGDGLAASGALDMELVRAGMDGFVASKSNEVVVVSGQSKTNEFVVLRFSVATAGIVNDSELLVYPRISDEL